MNALEIRNLSKRYDGFELKDISFTLPMGCIMGLIGENGAGKSTIIKLILDIVQRDGGEITIFGKDNRKEIKLLKEDIGVVFDEIGIPSYLKAFEVGNIMSLSFKNWDGELYNDYLKRLDIPADKQFAGFSRGMRMKLGIAVALSHHPKLLLLDEATSGLDPVVRDEVTDIFGDFTRDENHAVLISSHIVSDLEKLCDYVAFIHKGKLLLCEEKDALKDRYALIHYSAEKPLEMPKSSIVGIKGNPYGSQAIVERSALPYNAEFSPVGLEELFVFMVKGELNK